MTEIINVRLLYQAGLSKAAVDALVSVDIAQTAAQTDATTGITNAATAQTGADNAAAYRTTDTPSFVWNTDADDASWPGDDTRDLTIAWETKAGVAIADRVLRGTFTQSGATIAVTAVSNSETAAGVSTAYTLTGDGTKSVRANVTLTFADGSILDGAVSWSAQDLNTAGGTPATGGGK